MRSWFIVGNSIDVEANGVWKGRERCDFIEDPNDIFMTPLPGSSA